MSKEKGKIYRWLGRILGISSLIYLFSLKQLDAQIGFDGTNQGLYAQNSNVHLVNTAGDTITSTASLYVPRLDAYYWSKTASPGWIQVDDTCKAYIHDTAEQRKQYLWRVVTGASNGFIPACLDRARNYTIAIQNISDSGDTLVDGWVQVKHQGRLSDAVRDTFNVNHSFHDGRWNIARSESVYTWTASGTNWNAIKNDSVFVNAVGLVHGGTGSSKGIIQRTYNEGDVLPDIALVVNDITPPAFSNVTQWPDTSYAGPYPVKARITDASGVDTSKTRLLWRVNSGDSTIAPADSVKADTFFFTIGTILPQPETVNYKIKAQDKSPNQNIGYWPGPGAGNWYSFNGGDIKDVGIEAILNVPDSADSGTIIIPGVVIRNYGTINQDPELHCKINGFYLDSLNVVAQPGIDTFYFNPCSLNQVGQFPVTAYSVLQGDVNPANDTLKKTITVNPAGVVEEGGLENRVNYSVYPTITNGRVNVKGTKKVDVYDVSGRKVGSYEGSANVDGFDFYLNASSGVYFVKPEETGLPVKKVIKTK